MSNISLPDYDYLRALDADWAIFEHVFASGVAGMCKPDLCFYKYVLEETKSDPQFTVFVDDKLDNVLSARSFGMHGIIFEDPANVRTMLRHLVCDPVQRGQDFLQAQAGQLDSVTDTGLVIGDNFAQLLILDMTKQRDLVRFVNYPKSGKWNFFRDKPELTTAEFPFDFDTTSIGLTVLTVNRDTLHSVMDEMLDYRNEDGIIQMYFDHKRKRIDPVVCVNVLTLFYLNNRGEDLGPTLAWVANVLKHRAYLKGTRYYTAAEAFLYFMSHLLESTSDERVQGSLRALLRERLQERMGAPGDALALGMRISACATVGIRDEVDLRQLLTMQLENGAWGPGNVYKYGSSGIGIGNYGLARALAIKAILLVEEMGSEESNKTG